MFYHIRRLRQIRHLVNREVLTQLVTSLVLSLLDYCNAVLAGLPASMLAPLQHAHNAAARLALRLDRRSHITQRSRSYTAGCRSSTVSPSKLLLSCIRLSTIDARRTSLTLSCLLRPTRMYTNFAPPLLEPLPSNEAGRNSKGVPLSGRPRHMEQSPRHHPYHRLPPISLPSCPQDTSVPLGI